MMGAEGGHVQSKWLLWTAFIAACGGSAPRARSAGDIRLVPTVAMQAWYRSPAPCAQGPYELDVPTRGARYGEDVEVRVHAPHAVALHAQLLADGAEVARADGVFRGDGEIEGRPDNARCVASAEERLAIARGGAGGGGGGAAGGTGAPAGGAPEVPAATAAAELELDPGEVGSSAVVLHFRVPAAGAHLKVRLWSIEPNDLDGVRFGIDDVTWGPNVPEAQYEAHLAAVAAEEQRREAEEQRREAEEQRREAEEQRREAERWEREHAHDPVVRVDPAAEVRAREEAARRAAREEAAREEAARRAAIAAALEAERRRQRRIYCDGHPADRDCWGAGGRAVHDALDAHAAERTAYCAAHGEDARCWTEDVWSRHRATWDARVAAALAPPKQPDGPPPAPLAETIPPRLSVHAEWRPGYWQWTESKWVWLAGMWRVPESDIAAEQTTTAPAAPPPPRDEAPPPPPVTVAVWIPGFWQWSGSGWVWVAGSWQLRPAPRATWRAPEWRARGTVHVLIPGGWVQP